MSLGLIDELVITTLPVLIGQGIPLLIPIWTTGVGLNLTWS
jgi:hypothetical protein